MDYYYISYAVFFPNGCSGLGAHCLPQTLSEEYGSEDGLNFIQATQELGARFGGLCVIQSWQKINKARYDAWHRYLLEAQTTSVPRGPAPVIKLVRPDQPATPKEPCAPGTSEAPSAPTEPPQP